MSSALVLVTGSRNWADRSMIDNALWEAYLALIVTGPFTEMRVLHGHNRKGADAIADRWAIGRYYEGVRLHRVPAKWSSLCLPSCSAGHRRPNTWGEGDICPAQGNYRNQHMVDLMPIACLAFLWQTPSTGTEDCIRRADEANIPVLTYRRDGSRSYLRPEQAVW
jgi:hypothetical protein